MNYKRIAMIGAKDKGGVGLSTCETAMITIMRATGEGQFDVVAVDADGFNSTLTQLVGERDNDGKLLREQDGRRGAIKADLFDRDGIRPMFTAVESDARVVVIDTPAGAVTKFQDLSASLTARHFIDHIRANDRTPVILLPFTPSVASIRGIGKALEVFGNVEHIGARNMVGNRSDDYRLWSTTPIVNRYGKEVGGKVRGAFEAAGGCVIDMPAADPGAFALAEAMGLGFADAARYKGANYEQYDRLNMAMWLEDWVTQFRRIEGVLGLVDVEWKAF